MMLTQFLNSIMAHFIKVEPMSAYIQEMPEKVEYPCYLLNKLDVNTTTLNSFYFVNTLTLYIRIFGKDEVELKGRVFNLTNNLFETQRKIPILEKDGSSSRRYIRIEDIETIQIPVDENDTYCVELNFSFDTTHKINEQEFELLKEVNSTQYEKED